MAEPRYFVPKRNEAIVDSRGLQQLRFSRLLELLSRGSWNKDYQGATDTSLDFQVTSSPAVVSLIHATITPYQVDSQI